MGTDIVDIASSSICKGQRAYTNVLRKNKQTILKNRLAQPSCNQTRLFEGIFKSHVNEHDGCVHQHDTKADKHGIETCKQGVSAYIVDVSASMFYCCALMCGCCASLFFSLAYLFRHCVDMFCGKTCLQHCHVYKHHYQTLVQAFQTYQPNYSAYMHHRHVYYHQHCDNLHGRISYMLYNKDLKFQWLAGQHSFNALKQYTQTSNGWCASAVSAYIFHQPKF